MVRISTRSVVGLVLVASGALLLWIGWYEVSGETLVARQLPFVASASLPGLALLTAGALLLGGEIGATDDRAGAAVDALYRLLTEDEASSASGAAVAVAGPEPPAPELGPGSGEAASWVRLPDGTRYHRPSCLLVAGKPAIRAVGAAEIGTDHLEACPVCAPPPGA